jgi:hypothetical protein
VKINVFALRKMDKSRTQVSCHSSYSAERLIESAEEWRNGCVNLPSIRIGCWGKQKGTKPGWLLPEIPFPLEVVWCLNTPWTKAANDVQKRTREFSNSDGVSLLLDTGIGVRAILERALHAALCNGGNLLIAMAHTQHLGEIHKVSGKYERQKLILPTIYGLFLQKLGNRKEVYMKSAPFLIGRMLSLADQLHYQYCQGVRDGHAPGQLIGNALMATALENPEKALALYAQRILPYQAWAKTAHGESAGLAKFFLSELSTTSASIAGSEVPRRCGDPEKAQMLLGYLAKTEKSN